MSSAYNFLASFMMSYLKPPISLISVVVVSARRHNSSNCMCGGIGFLISATSKSSTSNCFCSFNCSFLILAFSSCCSLPAAPFRFVGGQASEPESDMCVQNVTKCENRIFESYFTLPSTHRSCANTATCSRPPQRSTGWDRARGLSSPFFSFDASKLIEAGTSPGGNFS